MCVIGFQVNLFEHMGKAFRFFGICVDEGVIWRVLQNGNFCVTTFSDFVGLPEGWICVFYACEFVLLGSDFRVCYLLLYFCC